MNDYNKKSFLDIMYGESVLPVMPVVKLVVSFMPRTRETLDSFSGSKALRFTLLRSWKRKKWRMTLVNLRGTTQHMIPKLVLANLDSMQILSFIIDIGIVEFILRENAKIVYLNLSRNGIDTLGAVTIAEALKVNKKLERLILSHNSIDDVGAMAIAETLKVNKNLTSLDLEANKITDAGAIAIAGALRENASLTSLDLDENRIGRNGVKAIAEALRANTKLTHLYINRNGNNFGDEIVMAFYEALKVNKSIERLLLYGNSVSDSVVKAKVDPRIRFN